MYETFSVGGGDYGGAGGRGDGLCGNEMSMGVLLVWGSAELSVGLPVICGLLGMAVAGCITPRGIHAECDARAMRVYANSGTATIADRDTRREVYELSYQRCVASFGAQEPLRRMPE